MTAGNQWIILEIWVLHFIREAQGIAVTSWLETTTIRIEISLTKRSQCSIAVDRVLAIRVPGHHLAGTVWVQSSPDVCALEGWTSGVKTSDSVDSPVSAELTDMTTSMASEGVAHTVELGTASILEV